PDRAAAGADLPHHAQEHGIDDAVEIGGLREVPAQLHQGEQIVLATRDQSEERRVLRRFAGRLLERLHQAALRRQVNASSSESTRVRKSFRFIKSRTARTSGEASAQMNSS